MKLPDSRRLLNLVKPYRQDTAEQCAGLCWKAIQAGYCSAL